MNTKVLDWSYYTGTVPGYGACRAVPGEYAGLLPDHYVETSFSGFTFQAPLPAQNINYVRIPHKPGDGRIAGGGQNSDHVLEWDVNKWVQRGTMWGPNGLVYGGGDTLVAVIDRPQYQATMGYRYGFGALVTCLSTYADVPRGIYEYTDFGDVAIGQGVDGRAVVSFLLPTGVGYEPLRALPLPSGCDARFMLTDRTGDQFGIAAVDLTHRLTKFFWPTLADLYALPKVGA